MSRQASVSPGIILLLSGLLAAAFAASTGQAQTSHTDPDCVTVTVHSQTQGATDEDGVDWYALMGEVDPNSVKTDKFTEGCLTDTTGIGPKGIVDRQEDGPQLVDMVEGDFKFHKSGMGMGSSTNSGSDSTRVDEQIEPKQASIFAIFKDQSLLMRVFMTLIPALLATSVVFLVLSLLRGDRGTELQIYKVRLPARIRVEDKFIVGRLVMLSNGIANFSPNVTSEAKLISTYLERETVPDFDLFVQDLSFAIVPDVPGMRLVKLHIVNELSHQEIQTLTSLSQVPARKERKRIRLQEVDTERRDELVRIRAGRLSRSATAKYA